MHFDHLQAALTMTEATWRSSPRKNDMFVIQQFCLRFVQLSASFKQRTGVRLQADESFVSAANPSARAQDATSLQPAYSYGADSRMKGSSLWPRCVNGPFDWATLFAPRGGEDHWLTPRMAARIHHVAVVDGDTMLEDIEFMTPCLPKVARSFFKRSREWRLNFQECYLRIAMRLQKGQPPRPNCTGEEMALHNIIDRAADADDAIGDEIDALPEYPNDDDFDMVKDIAVEDEDVLMLFEDADDGGMFGEDDDEPDVDNPVLGPGSMADFMLGSGGAMMRTANLHPSEWFKAFRHESIRDHLP